jgi:hypothetical protein
VSKLKTFAGLKRRDQALLGRAFACLLSCKARLLLTNFAQLQAWATDTGNGAEPMDRIRWAMGVALQLAPGATCLCRALALQRLLARNGHQSDLRIGVKKCGDDFRAHAWLLHEGQIVMGSTESEQYEVLRGSEPRSSMSARAETRSRTT